MLSSKNSVKFNNGKSSKYNSELNPPKHQYEARGRQMDGPEEFTIGQYRRNDNSRPTFGYDDNL